VDNSALILYLEDSPRDAELVRDKLQQTPSLACELRVVSNRAEYEAALDETRFDLILSEYALPDYDGMAALALGRARQPDVPFILISGTLGEERAVDCMVRGATDYVLKQNLNRLVPAVLRALTEAKERRKSRETEESLRQNEAKYRDLVENLNDVIFTVDLQGTLTYVSAPARQVIGYAPDELVGRSFQEIIHLDDLPGLNQRFREILENDITPWEFRFRTKDGEIRWARTSSRPIVESGRSVGIRGVLSDITGRKQAEEALSRSLEATLSVLSHAAELRDPYTAGHQRRVTELATALARELGFSDDECGALRVAGLLHDIGKLCIPAEILSKPGQLSAIEFSLIREHPQTAYDILTDVAFPGPVAEIVLQHHERLDGSGYPRGLAGEQILREARILAVADVVEAMASHRPYRAALGIDAALTEIRAGSGTRYDQQIADACLTLFESGQFSFSAMSSRA
jgi:PAS domain S-box-containing protein/putative nucleotidyltransferase with HDIG domain